MFHHPTDYPSTPAQALEYELSNTYFMGRLSLTQGSCVDQDSIQQIKTLDKPSGGESLIAALRCKNQINSDSPLPHLSATTAENLILLKNVWASRPATSPMPPLAQQTCKTRHPPPRKAKDFGLRARALPVKLQLRSLRKKWQDLERRNTLVDKKSKDQFVKEYFLQSLARGKHNLPSS
jgi:hypothetical protein